MITLTGTDKQIAWATDVRARILSEMATLRVECARAYPTAVFAVDEAVAELEGQASAAWWIDRRSCTGLAPEPTGVRLVSPFAALSKRVQSIVEGR